MSFEIRRVIAKDHPALAGHFPGNPVVPGVVILDEVLQAVERWRGDVRLKSVVSVKFVSALNPGCAFHIKLHEAGASCIAFECRRDGATLAFGRLAVEPGVGQA